MIRASMYDTFSNGFKKNPYFYGALIVTALFSICTRLLLSHEVRLSAQPLIGAVMISIHFMAGSLQIFYPSASNNRSLTKLILIDTVFVGAILIVVGMGNFHWFISVVALGGIFGLSMTVKPLLGFRMFRKPIS